MRNVFQKRGFFNLFLFTWGITFIIQFLAYLFYFRMAWQSSLIDALISNTILLFFLVAMIHVVRYSLTRNSKWFSSAMNLVSASLVLLVVWFLLSDFLFGIVLSSDVIYREFIRDTLIYRASTGLFIAIVINLGIAVIHMTGEAEEATRREVRLKNLVQQTELQALKNQLNPHFIYNSLNAIASLTITSPGKAREMIIKLSDFLRFALKQDAVRLIPLQEEIAAIELYLQIERIRFGESLKVSIDIHDEYKHVLVPVMILQPLFENAIKHGAHRAENNPDNLESNGDYEGNSWGISFHAKMKGEDIMLILSNPYDRRYHRFRGEGVGLENVRNRLRVLYGNGQLLRLETSEDRFIAMLTLPTIKKIKE